jgi:hypothetical protein
MMKKPYDQSVAFRQRNTIRIRPHTPETPKIIRSEFGQKYDQKKIGNIYYKGERCGLARVVDYIANDRKKQKEISL